MNMSTNMRRYTLRRMFLLAADAQAAELQPDVQPPTASSHDMSRMARQAIPHA